MLFFSFLGVVWLGAFQPGQGPDFPKATPGVQELPHQAKKDTLPVPADTLSRKSELTDSLGVDTLNYLHPDSAAIDSGRTKSGDDFLVDSLRDEFRADTLQALRSLDRVVVNNAFRVGEKLTFKIKYGMFRAGEATMEVEKVVPVPGNRTAYRIVSKARTAKFFDGFFKVRDSIATYVDTQGLFSWKFFKHQREGGYKVDLDVDYDQFRGIAHVKKIRYNNDDKMTVRKKEDIEISIPKYVVDILAAIYYVRTQPLEVGMPIYFPSHDNKKNYDLKVIIQRKERLKVKAGTFDCVVIQPQLKGEALFKQKGKLWIWLTDDEYKIPVKLKSKALLGSFTTELVKIEGVGDRQEARK